MRSKHSKRTAPSFVLTMTTEKRFNDSPPVCPFCGEDASAGQTLIASERMYGLGGRFVYRQCPRCGSLKLDDVPDMAAYYPADYYAFTHGNRAQSLGEQAVAAARAVIDRLEWTVPRLTGMHHLIALVRVLGIAPDAAVLDVGCGDGAFLRRLGRLGFT